jgi:hypothetical protein
VTPAQHRIAWQPPRPLWRGTTPFARAPQILRFASDDFMDQVIAMLEEDPAQLSRLIAKPETWRTPAAEVETPDLIQRVPLPAPLAAAKRRRLLALSRPAVPPPAPPPDQPLKLYQPAHMRHYLVAGSLTCAVPGLPEHVLAGSNESVGFVIRRLLPASAASTGDQTLIEFAFVQEAEKQRWLRVAADDGSPAVLAPGEELLPLFRVAHGDEAGRRHGLWAGVIPVGKREDYLGKDIDRTVVSLTEGQKATLKPGAKPPPTPSKAARLMTFKMAVAEPWKALIRAAVKASDDILSGDAGNPKQKRERILTWNLQFQMQSWLILLDFADWLETHMPRVWTAVKTASGAGLANNELTLFQRLQAANASALVVAMQHSDPPTPPPASLDLKSMAPSLAAALAQVRAAGVREILEAKTSHYGLAGAVKKEAGWPDFHFPLAGLDSGANAAGPFVDATKTLPDTAIEGDVERVATPAAAPAGGSEDLAERLDKFTALVGRSLEARSETDVQPPPFAIKLRDSLVAAKGDQGLFVIRFVYLNRDCGPLHPPTLSDPTQRFRMASFFDPDAPVRPIRITLPLDTSPAGLRKHGRGTAFVLSDMLCGQVQRAKGLGFVDLVRQVLPFPLHKDIDIGDGGSCKGSGGLEIGMICSLSIPIITLCALILLIIIVTLLDFIFRWLPWFILCLPVPGLKGKQGAAA